MHCERSYHQAAADHEGIVDVEELFFGRELHPQRTHHRHAVGMGVVKQRVPEEEPTEQHWVNHRFNQSNQSKTRAKQEQ